MALTPRQKFWVKKFRENEWLAEQAEKKRKEDLAKERIKAASRKSAKRKEYQRIRYAAKIKATPRQIVTDPNCPHGTTKGYYYYRCNCPDCKAWRADANKAYRKLQAERSMTQLMNPSPPPNGDESGLKS